MAKKRKGASSEKLSDVIVKGMQEKKAGDIVVMDLRKVKKEKWWTIFLISGKFVYICWKKYNE